MSVAESVEPTQSHKAPRSSPSKLLGSDAVLARLAVRLAIAMVLLLVGFVGFYSYDRFMVRVDSPLDTAVRELEEAVRANPNDPVRRAQVASAYVRQGRHDQAIAQYEEALKLKENWMPALLGMATAELTRGNEARAEEIYRQVAELNRDNELRYANADMQRVYYRLGLFASKAGRHAEAAEWATEALRGNRTDADSLFLLATSEEAQGNHAAARDAYRQAVAFDPNFREGFAGLQRTASALGDQREAAYARGMELLAAGDVDGALNTFRQLAAQTPDFGEAHLGLGLAYARKGQREESQQAFRAALDRNPSLLLAQWSLRPTGPER